MQNSIPLSPPRQPHAVVFSGAPFAGSPSPSPALDVVARPESVEVGSTVAWGPDAFIEAKDELARAAYRKKLPRGPTAARRNEFVISQVVRAFVALNLLKEATRAQRCGDTTYTAGCEDGHGGAVVNDVSQRGALRCGMGTCPICARAYASRLRRVFNEVMRHHITAKGFRWRFITLSLQPRRTYADSVRDIKHVRRELMRWLKRLHGRTADLNAVSAIEFGDKGHPHLHVLVESRWIAQQALSKKLVEWTGGTVQMLPPGASAPGGRNWVAVPPAGGAIGGDWYADVRELRGGIAAGGREVMKYLSDPFGGAPNASTPQGRARIQAAARNAVLMHVALAGSHRVQGYGIFKGLVGQAFGKKSQQRLNAITGRNAAQATVSLGPRPSVCCATCNKPLVRTKGIDGAAYWFFNRANPHHPQGPPLS